jgi:hypothetical protein
VSNNYYNQHASQDILVREQLLVKEGVPDIFGLKGGDWTEILVPGIEEWLGGHGHGDLRKVTLAQVGTDGQNGGCFLSMSTATCVDDEIRTGEMVNSLWSASGRAREGAAVQFGRKNVRVDPHSLFQRVKGESSVNYVTNG